MSAKITSSDLLKMLQDTQGPLSVNDGVLWFESGESVELNQFVTAAGDSGSVIPRDFLSGTPINQAELDGLVSYPANDLPDLEEETAKGQSVKPKMVQMTNIPKDMQESVLSSFWMMLTSCETSADNDNDPVLKHWVTQWYQQWNEITGDSKEPRFVTRERAKLAEEQNLPVMSLEEAKDAIQDGANLLLTHAGRFFVKAPGASPVSLSQEDGTQIMNHSSMGRSGMDSAGRITFGLQLGASFDGGQPRPRQM